MHPARSTQSKRHERSSTSMHNIYAYENDQPSSSQYPSSPHGLSQSKIHERPYSTHHASGYSAAPTKVASQSSHSRQSMARSHSDGHYYTQSAGSFSEHSLSTLQSFKGSQSIPSSMHSRSTRPAPPPHQSHSATIRPSAAGHGHSSSSHGGHSGHSSGHSAVHLGSTANAHYAPQHGASSLNESNLFNLQGILKIMKQQDPNYQMVTLGMDLTQLGGLDLNCPEPEIHHTFLSPWIDKWDDSNKFVTPQCYKFKRTNDHSATKYMARYKDTTLFYIFYSSVNDKLQVVAAKELYQRKWVYHKALQLWLHRMTAKDGGGGAKGSGAKSAAKKNKEKKRRDGGGKDEAKQSERGRDGNASAPAVKGLAEDKMAVFVRDVKVDDIEYFDVECWKTKHFYTKFPVDWTEEKTRLLSEHDLNHFCRGMVDQYL